MSHDLRQKIKSKNVIANMRDSIKKGLKRVEERCLGKCWMQKQPILQWFCRKSARTVQIAGIRSTRSGKAAQVARFDVFFGGKVFRSPFFLNFALNLLFSLASVYCWQLVTKKEVCVLLSPKYNVIGAGAIRFLRTRPRAPHLGRKKAKREITAKKSL